MTFNIAPNSKDTIVRNMSWVDYFIFVLVLIICLCTGTGVKFFGKIEATLSYYLMGGKRMTSLSTAVSLVAWLVLTKFFLKLIFLF